MEVTSEVDQMETTSNDKLIGKRINELRDHKQMTITQFADFLGSTEPTLKHYLYGTKSLPANRAFLIADKCDVSLSWLLEGKGSMYDKHMEDTASIVIEMLHRGFNLMPIFKAYESQAGQCIFDCFKVSIDKHLNDLLERIQKLDKDKAEEEKGVMSGETYNSHIRDIKRSYNNAINSGEKNITVDWILLPDDKITQEVVNILCENNIRSFVKNQTKDE